MPGDPHGGSKVWEAPDREIGKSGKNRGKAIAHRDLQPTAAFHDRENRCNLRSRLNRSGFQQSARGMTSTLISCSAVCRNWRGIFSENSASLSSSGMCDVDLRTVQELMGQKTIQITVRYAHLAPKHKLAAVQRLCDTGGVPKAASDTTTDTRSLAVASGASSTVH